MMVQWRQRINQNVCILQRLLFSTGRSRSDNKQSFIVLGIESSCDDSCVGIIDFSKRKVLADERTSQFHIHNAYGGIVPILAVREHETNLPKVLEKALESVSGETIDLIAVSTGPGLKACLRTGMNQALKLGDELKVPVIGVNHLEAHTLVCRLENPSIKFPFMTLLASGGHTLLSIAEAPGKHVELGSTLDDAMGEAFDKVIRSLNDPEACSRHGGAVLEALARKGKPNPALKLPIALRGPTNKRPRSYDFSFSGLKSSTSRAIAKQVYPAEDIAWEFQHAAVEHAVNVVQYAVVNHPSIQQLAVCGGVASNSLLRSRLDTVIFQKFGVQVLFPSAQLCVDNGVMVAWAGAERWLTPEQIINRENLLISKTTNPRARWPLSELV
jgi:N6-L-threonylcarbamoyladenine synthase